MKRPEITSLNLWMACNICNTYLCSVCISCFFQERFTPVPPTTCGRECPWKPSRCDYCSTSRTLRERYAARPLTPSLSSSPLLPNSPTFERVCPWDHHAATSASCQEPWKRGMQRRNSLLLSPHLLLSFLTVLKFRNAYFKDTGRAYNFYLCYHLVFLILANYCKLTRSTGI